jgi:hypothetical protein
MLFLPRGAAHRGAPANQTMRRHTATQRGTRSQSAAVKAQPGPSSYYLLWWLHLTPPGLITDVAGRLCPVWRFSCHMVCNARTNGLAIIHNLLL